LKKPAGQAFRVLRLHDVPHTIWFEDRPARQAGHIPTAGFARSWADFGFAADPPNAALTLLRGDNREDTVILELSRPRYRAKTRTIRYGVHRLRGATGNLAGFEPDRDRRVPRHFEDASLFIDDATAPVVNGCVIQPYSHCADADLSGADLPGADLDHADLSGANLSHADLSGADLSYTDLVRSNLTGADLTGANLRAANVRVAVAESAQMEGANLLYISAADSDFNGASLPSANLTHANFEEASLRDVFLAAANLSYASFAGADMTGAVTDSRTIFCHTEMPEGNYVGTNC